MFGLIFWPKYALFLFIYVPIQYGDAKKSANAGPYKLVLSKVVACENPSRPYMNDSPMFVALTVHNTSNSYLLDGNVTIYKDVKNVKHKLRSFVDDHGKWKTNSIINDIGCHSILLHYICVTAGIKYDRKNCIFSKGQYFFEKMDPDYFQHLITSKMEYSKMLWIFESYSPQKGTLICLEFYVVTEPA